MDIVLCEKKVLCEKNGIRLSCDVDGKDFGFLSASETYSLFGNIKILFIHFNTNKVSTK